MRTTITLAAGLLIAIFAATPAGASPPPAYHPIGCHVSVVDNGVQASCTVNGITVGGFADCTGYCDLSGYNWDCAFSGGGPVDYFRCPVPSWVPSDAVCTLTPTSAGVYGSCDIAGQAVPIHAGCDTCMLLIVGPTCTIGIQDGAPVGYCQNL
jgi:hypothetical protein